MKLCPKCSREKPLDSFPKDRCRVDGRFSYCKECNYKHSRAWVLKNKARAAGYQAGYRQRQENRDAKSVHQQRYFKRLAGTTDGRERLRNYVRSNRAHRRGATLTITDINARVAACGAACVYCGGDYTDIDHVVAISRGGSDDPMNLVPSCGDCNQSKARREWKRWFRTRSFYSTDREARILMLVTPA
jgi:5-methylcytosine-specific restriction endonuclease McrA